MPLFAQIRTSLKKRSSGSMEKGGRSRFFSRPVSLIFSSSQNATACLSKALTAHVAIVFTRYLMIAMEQHRSEDERTLGEIFFFFTDELADITFGESFQIIITAMLESVCAIFQPTQEQMALFIEMFVGRLPEYIRNSLAKASLAA